MRLENFFFFSVVRLDSRAEKKMITATLAISEGWNVGPNSKKMCSHRRAPLIFTPRGVSTSTSRTMDTTSMGMVSSRQC